jgi:ATP-dependent helicase/nuclease subunit A
VPDAETLRRLEENLAFVYPHRAAENLPSKLTATELKGRREADEDAQSLSTDKPSFTFRRPDFARADKPLTGAERGTATHLVLQYMDFAAAGSLESIKNEIERLRRIQVISDREAEAVDAEAIDRLFRSPLGQRMLHAEQREREFKFSLLVDAASLGGAEGEEQLLQGVVDCCIIEEGALTVIDYKTDGVRTSEQIAARSAYYAGQLHAYAMALTRIFALPVKECVLYYLAAGEAVRVPM